MIYSSMAAAHIAYGALVLGDGFAPNVHCKDNSAVKRSDNLNRR